MHNLEYKLEKLTTTNYQQWSNGFEATAGLNGLWEYFTGEEVDPMPQDKKEAELSKDEKKERKEWRLKKTQAASLIWLAIDLTQQSHIADDSIRKDPLKAWTTLRDIHLQKKPATIFTSYDVLLSIVKKDNEDLSSLCSRVSEQMQEVKKLRKVGYTLEDLDRDLESMALIRALPDEYNNFTSSLLLLDGLDRNKIVSAYHSEQIQRKHREERAAAAAATIAAAAAAIAPLPVPTITKCGWCGRSNHVEENCYTKANSRKRDQDRTRGGGKGKKGGESKSNAAAEETATEGPLRT